MVLGFRPSRDGFRFGNSWPRGAPVKLAGMPLGRVHGGLCGGMAYAAGQAWLAGRPLPDDAVAPARGPLADRLWRAQLASLDLPLGPLRYLWFQLPPGEDRRRRLTLTHGTAPAAGARSPPARRRWSGWSGSSPGTRGRWSSTTSCSATGCAETGGRRRGRDLRPQPPGRRLGPAAGRAGRDGHPHRRRPGRRLHRRRLTRPAGGHGPGRQPVEPRRRRPPGLGVPPRAGPHRPGQLPPAAALLGPQPRVVPVPQPRHLPLQLRVAWPPGARTASRRRPRRRPRSPARRRAGSPGTGTARPARPRRRRRGPGPAAGLPQLHPAQAGRVHHRAQAGQQDQLAARWSCAVPCRWPDRRRPGRPRRRPARSAGWTCRHRRRRAARRSGPGRRWPRSSSSPRPSTVLVSSTGAASAVSATSSRSDSAVRDRSALVSTTTGCAPESQATASSRSSRAGLGAAASETSTSTTSTFAASTCRAAARPAAPRTSSVRRGSRRWPDHLVAVGRSHPSPVTSRVGRRPGAPSRRRRAARRRSRAPDLAGRRWPEAAGGGPGEPGPARRRLDPRRAPPSSSSQPSSRSRSSCPCARTVHLPTDR